jgi:hypothetical protein
MWWTISLLFGSICPLLTVMGLTHVIRVWLPWVQPIDVEMTYARLKFTDVRLLGVSYSIQCCGSRAGFGWSDISVDANATWTMTPNTDMVAGKMLHKLSANISGHAHLTFSATPANVAVTPRQLIVTLQQVHATAYVCGSEREYSELVPHKALLSIIKRHLEEAEYTLALVIWMFYALELCLVLFCCCRCSPFGGETSPLDGKTSPLAKATRNSHPPHVHSYGSCTRMQV